MSQTTVLKQQDKSFALLIGVGDYLCPGFASLPMICATFRPSPPSSKTQIAVGMHAITCRSSRGQTPPPSIFAQR